MMKENSLWAHLLILAVLISIPPTSPYHISGNLIYDLEDNTSQASLTSEAGPWYLSLYRTAGLKVYYCAGYYLLGSYCILGGSGTGGSTPYYGQYFRRTYTPPVAHNQINIQMRVYTIDSWDGPGTDDHFEIGIDGTPLYAWRINGFNGIYANTNICGASNYNDFPPFTVYMSYPHSSTTSLELKIISCADEDSCNESIGFRDIRIEFVTTSSPVYSLCAVGTAPLSSSPCPCARTNMYMDPPNSGICYDCDGSCATCTGPYSSQCVTCPDGRYLSGTYCPACDGNCATCSGSSTTCLSCPTGWFMVGNTCYSSCPSPLKTTVVGSVTYCYTPCPGQYVYWDGACSSTCAYGSNAAVNFPIYGSVVNTFSMCNYACASTSQVLYWNGTCASSCAAPLSPSVFHGSTFCDYQCGSSQYLYWNGSCLNNCPSPLSGELQGSSYARQFCWYTCQPGDYLYWNQSCISTCPSPLTGEVQGSSVLRKFCWYTCQPSQYLYWNGSCLNNCPWPLSPETEGTVPTSFRRNFCWYYCQPGEYMYWNGSCVSTCPSPLTPEIQGTNLPRQFCWYTCQPSQYLYWNGSCLNSCPWPLSPETQGSNPTYQRNFCWYYCQPGEYMYWNGSCISTCPWPLTPETQGTNLPRQFCWYTCQPSQYLYWNGSCVNSCPWPLSPETQGSSPTYKRNFCWYYCQPNEYLYWNGSCISDCPAPLAKETQGTYLPRQFCWYLCQPTQFLYWNLSCLNDCPAPLTPETQGSLALYKRNFCWYTCQPGEFLLWNYTCSGTCPYPLTNEVQGTYLTRKFCWYPCMPWQWLNWDQTCQETCISPLWPETQGSYLSRQFCWYPCTSESKYLYWNGTCLPECPEPLSTRYQNGQWFCDYPCGSDYLYWNGSCISTCASPLLSVSEGNPLKKFCYYPCQVNQFSYWDGSCQSTCAYPLVPNAQGTPKRQFCWYLCSTTSYLYWNGSCSSSCDPPLVQRTTNSRKFCDYPCVGNQYLYWNGSCLSTCPYSLSVRVEGSPIKKNYCDFLCSPSQYLYWNGSCYGTCDFPLSKRIEGSGTNQRVFCDYPCVGNQYLYWNGTCSSKCNLPLVVRIEAGNRFCDFLCPASQVVYWDGTCGTSCNAPLTLISQGTPVREYCQYKCKVTQFLFPNETCSDSCNFPLSSSVQKGRLFCKYPCTGTDFLYFNGSCIGSCDTPFVARIENSLQYCDYSCVDGNFLYWNGSCLSGCEYPLSQRVANGHLYCDFSCPISTDFLYWNGTCSSQCPDPLSSRSEGVSVIRNYCSFKCGTSEYLYWNQTCSEKCDFPWTKATYGDASFCYYPCDVNEYLYWNGSCLLACSFPLSSRVDAGLKYCDFPCTTGSYLYWNGSCLANCETPLSLRAENDKFFCDYPCTNTNNYLYWNTTCSSQCSSPYIPKAEGSASFSRNYCHSPCDPSDYLYWNNSCLPSCPTPFLIHTSSQYRFCNPPCAITQFYYDELKACEDECHQPAFITNDDGYLRCSSIIEAIESSGGSHFYMFLNAPLKPGTVTVVNLIKMMQYVRYLDIQMPPRLQRLGLSKGRNVLSFSAGIHMSDSMKQDFMKQTLPITYLKNNLHSSFLVNFWEDLSNIFIGFAIACIFFVFEMISRALDWSTVEVVCHTIRVLARWNYVLMILAVSFDDIILFSALEFQSLNFSSSGSSNGFSFFFSLAAILAILILSLGMLLYAKKKSKRAQRRSFISEDFQVLFRGFRENNIFNQLFFLIYMFRIGIPMLIAVSLKVSPLAVTIFQVLISLGILVYLLKMKPFVKKINQQQIVLFESIILIMNVSMFVLTILSILGLHNTTGAIVLGDLVILGNDIVNILCLVFLVIKLYNEIRTLRDFIKRNVIKRVETIGLWLQLLFVPLQLSNMGFEEMVVYDFKNADRPGFRRGKLGKEKTQYELQNDFADRSFDKVEMNSTRIVDQQTTERHQLNHNEEEEFDQSNNEMRSVGKVNELETFGDETMNGENKRAAKFEEIPRTFQSKSILKNSQLKSQGTIDLDDWRTDQDFDMEHVAYSSQQVNLREGSVEGNSSIYKFMKRKESLPDHQDNFEYISNIIKAQRSSYNSSEYQDDFELTRTIENNKNRQTGSSGKGWKKVRKYFNEDVIRTRSVEQVSAGIGHVDENVVLKLWQDGKQHFNVKR